MGSMVPTVRISPRRFDPWRVVALAPSIRTRKGLIHVRPYLHSAESRVHISERLQGTKCCRRMPTTSRISCRVLTVSAPPSPAPLGFLHRQRDPSTATYRTFQPMFSVRPRSTNGPTHWWPIVDLSHFCESESFCESCESQTWKHDCAT
jgi:hypothetical protein